MKEIFRFLQWQWHRFEFWQLCFIFSMLLSVVSIAVPQPWATYMNITGLSVILLFFAKWAVWDGVRSAWQRYKQDRNQLLTTIRDSDQ